MKRVFLSIMAVIAIVMLCGNTSAKAQSEEESTTIYEAHAYGSIGIADGYEDNSEVWGGTLSDPKIAFGYKEEGTGLFYLQPDHY